MVSDFTLMSLKKNCLWTNHEKHVFCPKFPLTCLKMLLVGQNVPKLVRHHACYITVLQMSPNIWEIYTFIDITRILLKHKQNYETENIGIRKVTNSSFNSVTRQLLSIILYSWPQSWQFHDGINRINDVDVRLVSKRAGYIPQLRQIIDNPSFKDKCKFP